MILFATSNEFKFNEVREFMNRHGIEVRWEKRTYEEIQGEDTRTISLDSCKKLSVEIGKEFFLEDTGIYIDSLGGFPGPYSSYVQSSIGNHGILKLMENKAREARFITVISYYDGFGIYQFTGEARGRISENIREGRKFGYDPIFIPAGLDKAMSEIGLEEKNKVSSRGHALEEFLKFLQAKGHR